MRNITALLCLLLIVSSASAFCPYSFLYGDKSKEERKNIQPDTDTLHFLTHKKEEKYNYTIPPVVKSALETNDAYFEQIVNTKYATLPSWKGLGITHPWNLIKFGFESMKVTMDRTENFMPKGRVKYIHCLGSVA